MHHPSSGSAAWCGCWWWHHTLTTPLCGTCMLKQRHMHIRTHLQVKQGPELNKHKTMYVFSISFSKHLAHLEYNYSQKYIFIPQLFIQTQCTPLVNSTPWGQKRILPHPPTPTKSKLAILHGISMLLHTPPFYLLFIFLDIWFRH